LGARKKKKAVKLMSEIDGNGNLRAILLSNEFGAGEIRWIAAGQIRLLTGLCVVVAMFATNERCVSFA
jgi:hypothetical protein